jgi:hypothetical protein
MEPTDEISGFTVYEDEFASSLFPPVTNTQEIDSITQDSNEVSCTGTHFSIQLAKPGALPYDAPASENGQKFTFFKKLPTETSSTSSRIQLVIGGSINNQDLTQYCCQMGLSIHHFSRRLEGFLQTFDKLETLYFAYWHVRPHQHWMRSQRMNLSIKECLNNFKLNPMSHRKIGGSPYLTGS